MTESLSLTRIIPWAHRALGEVLSPGAFAVDLTAGNGHDTLFLYRCVGPGGRVVAFDIQADAVQRTAARLREAGAAVTIRGEWKQAQDQLKQGVHLVCADHSDWGEFVTSQPRAVVANLGYLPGASSPVATRPESTLRALEHGLSLLEPGGRLAMVCYVGHPGGSREGESVAARFAVLDPGAWRVLRVAAENHREAPFLLVAEKRGVPRLATARDCGTVLSGQQTTIEETPMADVYTCKNCGTTTTEKGHLCNPSLVEDTCDLCSEPVQNARHICKPMRSKLEYVCGGCGRPATSPDLVCKPEKIGG